MDNNNLNINFCEFFDKCDEICCLLEKMIELNNIIFDDSSHICSMDRDVSEEIKSYTYSWVKNQPRVCILSGIIGEYLKDAKEISESLSDFSFSFCNSLENIRLLFGAQNVNVKGEFHADKKS